MTIVKGSIQSGTLPPDRQSAKPLNPVSRKSQEGQLAPRLSPKDEPRVQILDDFLEHCCFAWNGSSILRSGFVIGVPVMVNWY